MQLGAISKLLAVEPVESPSLCKRPHVVTEEDGDRLDIYRILDQGLLEKRSRFSGLNSSLGGEQLEPV